MGSWDPKLLGSPTGNETFRRDLRVKKHWGMVKNRLDSGAADAGPNEGGKG